MTQIFGYIVIENRMINYQSTKYGEVKFCLLTTRKCLEIITVLIHSCIAKRLCDKLHVATSKAA